MKSGNPIYYWDSSVIIAYLKGENRPPGEMGGLYAIARAINSGNASLLVSTLVRVEVLDSTLRPGVGEKFRNFLTRSNVQEQAVDHYIANLAHDIRNYYLARDLRLCICPFALLRVSFHYKLLLSHLAIGNPELNSPCPDSFRPIPYARVQYIPYRSLPIGPKII